MYSKAKIHGHPIHPMLVAFPITFYTTTLVAFAVFGFFSHDPFWYRLGYFCNYAGIITSLAAAIPGFIDWAFGIPKASAAKKRGLIHMVLNVMALGLFAYSAHRIYGTWGNPPTDATGLLLLPLIGVLLTLSAGYHGWELVATHKVGVALTPQQESLEPIQEMDRKEHETDIQPNPNVIKNAAQLPERDIDSSSNGPVV